MVKRFLLVKPGTADALLTDGTATEVETFSRGMLWIRRTRNLEVVANDGELPELGFGPILCKEPRIDDTNLMVLVETLARCSA